MEAADERHYVLASRGEARQLDCGLDRLSAGVADERARRAVDRGDLVQLGGELCVDRQVEVRCAEMDEVAHLALYCGGDSRMGIAGRGHRYASGEVEEDVAVDVLDCGATATHRDEGVGARQARRRELMIERDVAPRPRPGYLGPKIRNGLKFC